VLQGLTVAGLAGHLRCLAIMSFGETVSAKKSAGDVCLTWRKRCLDPNILENAGLGVTCS